MKNKKALVYLEDGTIFEGLSVGIEGTSFGEICFNTGMTGYQEIFTDKSYLGQIVTMSNVHVGNYGIIENGDEQESENMTVSAVICNKFSYDFSRENANTSLFGYIKNNNKLIVEGVDTRALISHIRDNGVMNAIITTEILKVEDLKKLMKKIPNMKGLDLASKVSTKEPYFYGDENYKYRLAIIDMGIKTNILRSFAERGIYMQVFPYNTDLKQIEKWNPNGYFLSNGPGDPKPLECVQKLTKEIISKEKPLFGICMGHQIIALSQGMKVYKMLNGHRGINHPVKNLITGKSEITSQNHGFTVDMKSLEQNQNFDLTHIHLNDNTVAGMKSKNGKCMSVQYHPEAGPGTNDSKYLFDEFIEIMS